MGVLIVANRLPVTLEVAGDGLRLVHSTGGLATGLRAVHAKGDGAWLGWPGAPRPLQPRERDEVERALAPMRAHPVWLSRACVRGFYDGVSNGVLWPLLHDQPERMACAAGDLDAWLRVNDAFAREAARHLRPGDLAWVHDYQLAAVPGLMRAHAKDARIGFFLHVPFPAPEPLRALPWRRLLLEGMLGADLVGVHTEASARHFVAACAEHLGARVRGDTVHHGGRRTRVRAFPMGVDAAHWAALARTPLAQGVRRTADDHAARMLLAVDRLDITKGIPRRLVAFAHLLDAEPALRGRVRLVQVAVPSREALAPYRQLRRSVEALVGRINGAHARPGWTPVELHTRALPEAELAGLYAAADVMVVTPLRDGMNLVAKEYCAVQGPDGRGALVLSELAGAAAQLRGALEVNPYDTASLAHTLERALALPASERGARMRTLHAEVATHDVHVWADSFLAALAEGPPERGPDTVVTTAARARRLVLVLDWDGTLTPHVAEPGAARPDPEVLALLAGLARVAEVHLASGRHRAELEAWFGHLPVDLHAEHGHAWRPRGDAGWSARAWRRPERIVTAAQGFARARAGVRVEPKPAGLALHWRAAPQHAEACAEWARHAARATGMALLEGSCVVELRPPGSSKARVVGRLRARGATILALGDDRTDAELFAALPAEALRVQVGDGPRFAGVRLRDPHAARGLLWRLLHARGG